MSRDRTFPSPDLILPIFAASSRFDHKSVQSGMNRRGANYITLKNPDTSIGLHTNKCFRVHWPMFSSICNYKSSKIKWQDTRRDVTIWQLYGVVLPFSLLTWSLVLQVYDWYFNGACRWPLPCHWGEGIKVSYQSKERETSVLLVGIDQEVGAEGLTCGWQTTTEEVKLKLLRCHWKDPERGSVTELEKVTPGDTCVGGRVWNC